MQDQDRFSRNKLYGSASQFLSDLRNGTLKERFLLSNDVWLELLASVSSEPDVARLISEMAVVLILNVDQKEEVDGLLALAEVCG